MVEKKNYLEGRLMLRFGSRKDAAAIIKRYNLQIRNIIQCGGEEWLTVKVPVGEEQDWKEKLENNLRVLEASLDHIIFIDLGSIT